MKAEFQVKTAVTTKSCFRTSTILFLSNVFFFFKLFYADESLSVFALRAFGLELISSMRLN